MNELRMVGKVRTGMLVFLLVFFVISAAQAGAMVNKKGNDFTTREVMVVEADICASTYVGKAPLQVQFTADGSFTNVGKIESYEWNLCHGAKKCGVIVNHTFDDPGSYKVVLTVKNSSGMTDQDTINIEVLPNTMHVDRMSIELIQRDDGLRQARVEVLIYDGEGLPVPGVMVLGRWRGVLSARTRAVAMTDYYGRARFVSMATAREGIIKFKVTDAGTAGYAFIDGHNEIEINTDEDVNLPPDVSISTNTLSGPPPFAVTFSGAGCSDPDGSIVSYVWDFGDGNVGEGVTVEHLYKGVGTFDAVLTVTDDRGATASGKVIITVIGEAD